MCINVYAGITPHGMTIMHMVAGTSRLKTPHKTQQQKPAKNITKREYKEVLLKTLLSKSTKLFTGGKHISLVLQQDGDCSHGVAGRVLAEWNKAHAFAMQLLPNWPPSNPDLNIIVKCMGFGAAKRQSAWLQGFC